MRKIELSPKQQEVVNLNDGAFLILASAGSGKTRVLTERIKRLSEISDKNILAITFTNKAASEIRERLELNEQNNKNVFVGTFHSFCQSILELRFKLLGYIKMPHIFEDDGDRVELVKEAIMSSPYFSTKYNNLEPKKRNEYTYNALQFISTVKREIISAEELVRNTEYQEFQYLYEIYQDILKSNNAIDFDDIIRLIYELFTNNESVANLYRKSYSHLCIDECQDLNKLQYYLLKSLCGNTIKNVMMVGDPNQAIYGFNGSKSSFMQKDFINDFQATEITLEENYRCSKSIIEASNKLMNLNVEVINYVIPGLFKVYQAPSELDEAKFVISEIKKLIESKSHSDIEGEISFNKISILGRNKFVFKQIERLLTSEGLPFYYKSGNTGIKFSSSAMKIFYLLFRVKINPLDRLHIKKLHEYLKIDDIDNIEQLSSSKFPIASKIKNIVDEINMDNLHLKVNELKSIFENNSSIEDNDDERKMMLDELEDFSHHLFQYKKQKSNPSLEGFQSALALGLTNPSVSGEIGICLSTVHTMKGQESDIVFLIGMDEGTFPDYRAIKNGGDELQQEKNNTYVAFTRAKRFLFITYPKQRLMPWGDIKIRYISQFLRIFPTMPIPTI